MHVYQCVSVQPEPVSQQVIAEEENLSPLSSFAVRPTFQTNVTFPQLSSSRHRVAVKMC